MERVKFPVPAAFRKQFIDMCDLLTEEAKAGNLSTKSIESIITSTAWIPRMDPVAEKTWDDRGPPEAA